jgi:hypothetical protein
LAVNSNLAPRICSRWFDWTDVRFNVNDEVAFARQVRKGFQIFVAAAGF